MPIQLTRRTTLAAAAALALVPLAGCATSGASPTLVSETTTQTAESTPFDQEFKQLETEYDARLGVYAVDTGTDQDLTYRADERFAYASTHKALSAGAVLDQTPIQELDKVITYTEEDLLDYAPITKQHVDTGMTLREIIDAAIRYSDNTAANLLFEELGGPRELDAALEKIGDDVTHVDRIEPELNEATPGDIRDTSTPQAMATSLRKYTLGDALPADKREILTDMLIKNTTGDELIRAGVPDGWKVGDKTGSAEYGTRNDIAVIWPPDDDPIVLAVMSSRDAQDAEYDNALIAEAAEVAVEALA